MKASVLKENLSKALSVCGRVISTRGSLEILSNVLLSAQSGRIKISATNLEIGINYWIGGKVEKEGDLTIPARLFTDVVNSLASEKIELEKKDTDMIINAGGDTLSIKGLPADDYPLIPKIKNKEVISIKANVLKEALNLVNFAAALDESRPVLSGIYFLIEGDTLTLAATDSYRLAENKVKLEKKVEKKIEVVVPARTMIELARILGELNEEVKIYVDENQIMFAAKDIEFTSRLIEGQFPNYQQIIPEDNETKALVESQGLNNILKVATLFARESANSVNLIFKVKGEIEVKATSSQIGESDSKLKAEVTGKDGEITFNGKYITDVLNNLKEKKISFEMTGKLNPGVIKPEGNKDYVYIIMPLRS